MFLQKCIYIDLRMFTKKDSFPSLFILVSQLFYEDRLNSLVSFYLFRKEGGEPAMMIAGILYVGICSHAGMQGGL